MRVHLVHGIHATKPGGNTSALKSAFEALGFDVMVRSYGYALALTTGLTDWLNNRRAEKLARTIADGDVIVAHSNGCAVGWLIQRDWRKLSALILIQPALENDAPFDNTDHVLVLHNAKDDVVGLSTLGLASAWGDLGRVGYKGESQNVTSWDTLAPPQGLPSYAGHSGLFDEDKRPHWARMLAAWLSQRVKEKPVAAKQVTVDR